MRSPPTSRAIDARSSVVVTTFSRPCASAGVAASNSPTATTARRNLLKFILFPLWLKRMRAVSAYRKHELKQQLVGRRFLRISDTTKLSPNLAELAGPVGQRQRLPAVMHRRIVS